MAPLPSALSNNNLSKERETEVTSHLLRKGYVVFAATRTRARRGKTRIERFFLCDKHMNKHQNRRGVPRQNFHHHRRADVRRNIMYTPTYLRGRVCDNKSCTYICQRCNLSTVQPFFAVTQTTARKNKQDDLQRKKAII